MQSFAQIEKTDPLVAAVYCAVNGHNFIQGMRSNIDGKITHYMRCVHCGAIELVEEVSRLQKMAKEIQLEMAQEKVPERVTCKLTDHDLVELNRNNVVAGQDNYMKCLRCGEIIEKPF